MTTAVLMPYKNSKDTIIETLESLKSQTYKDFVLLAVESIASTDNSRQIICDFCVENNIAWVDLKSKHDLLTSSLNAGLFFILQNEFDYIARLDSDDIWLPEKLEKQIKFLEQNPDVFVLGTQIQTFSSDENFRCPVVDYPTDHNNIVRCLFESRNAIAHPSVIIRPEVFYKCGVYDDIYDMCEDYQLWMKISKNFRMANLPDTLVKYRCRHNPKYNPLTPILCRNLYGSAIKSSLK